jgi:hypothetical protein
MVKRNTTIPYEFVCYTENPKGINPGITVKSLPPVDLKGWWYKVMFFDPNHELQGNILFLDLDVVVFNNIDKLFTHEPGKFCIIRDFNRVSINSYRGMNSSVFRITTGDHAALYKTFMQNPAAYTRRYRGDQELMMGQIKNNFYFWPDNWIESYKWEMRGKDQIVRDGMTRTLKQGTPKIREGTSIAVFHGKPDPHECLDTWVIENWR